MDYDKYKYDALKMNTKLLVGDNNVEIKKSMAKLSANFLPMLLERKNVAVRLKYLFAFHQPQSTLDTKDKTRILALGNTDYPPEELTKLGRVHPLYLINMYRYYMYQNICMAMELRENTSVMKFMLSIANNSRPLENGADVFDQLFKMRSPPQLLDVHQLMEYVCNHFNFLLYNRKDCIFYNLLKNKKEKLLVFEYKSMNEINYVGVYESPCRFHLNFDSALDEVTELS
jgi:hypothetical protein